MGAPLPKGFILDETEASGLPEGFIVDEAKKPLRQTPEEWEAYRQSLPVYMRPKSADELALEDRAFNGDMPFVDVFEDRTLTGNYTAGIPEDSEKKAKRMREFRRNKAEYGLAQQALKDGELLSDMSEPAARHALRIIMRGLEHRPDATIPEIEYRQATGKWPYEDGDQGQQYIDEVNNVKINSIMEAGDVSRADAEERLATREFLDSLKYYDIKITNPLEAGAAGYANYFWKGFAPKVVSAFSDDVEEWEVEEMLRHVRNERPISFMGGEILGGIVETAALMKAAAPLVRPLAPTAIGASQSAKVGHYGLRVARPVPYAAADAAAYSATSDRSMRETENFGEKETPMESAKHAIELATNPLILAAPAGLSAVARTGKFVKSGGRTATPQAITDLQNSIYPTVLRPKDRGGLSTWVDKALRQPSAEDRASDMLIKDLERGGMTPDDLTASANAARRPGGSQEVVGELGGENVKRLARASASVPGPAGETAQKVLAKRQDETFGKLAKSSGGKDDFADVKQSIIGRYKDAAKAAYENFRESVVDPIIFNSRIARSLRTDLGREALSATAARLRQRASNVVANPKILDDESIYTGARQMVDAAQDIEAFLAGKSVVLSPASLDSVKRSYDILIEKALKGQGESGLDAATLIETKNAFADIVDQATGGAYAPARRIFQDGKGVEDAFDVGVKASGDKTWQLQEKLSMLAKRNGGELSEAQVEAVALGFARDILDKIEANALGAARRLLRDKRLQSNFRAVLGDAAFKRFEKQVSRSVNHANFRTFVLGGSPTARIAEDIADRAFESSFEKALLGVEKSGLGVGFGLKIRIANMLAKPTAKAIRDVITRFRRGGIRDNQVNEILGQWLFAKATPQKVKEIVATLNKRLTKNGEKPIKPVRPTKAPEPPKNAGFLSLDVLGQPEVGGGITGAAAGAFVPAENPRERMEHIALGLAAGVAAGRADRYIRPTGAKAAGWVPGKGWTGRGAFNRNKLMAEARAAAQRGTATPKQKKLLKNGDAGKPQSIGAELRDIDAAKSKSAASDLLDAAKIAAIPAAGAAGVYGFNELSKADSAAYRRKRTLEAITSGAVSVEEVNSWTGGNFNSLYEAMNDPDSGQDIQRMLISEHQKRSSQAAAESSASVPELKQMTAVLDGVRYRPKGGQGQTKVKIMLDYRMAIEAEDYEKARKLINDKMEPVS